MEAALESLTELMVDLQSDLGRDEIELGLQRLSELELEFNPAPVTSSEAKDRWSAIANDAERGVMTFIQQRGVSLVVLPAPKLVAIAARAQGTRTIGDILDAHPGVDTNIIPRINSPGGPVRSLRLPEGEPAAE